CPARAARADRALAMGSVVHVWPAARFRLRWRVERSRPAADRNSRGVIVLQCWRRDGTTAVHRIGVRLHGPRAAPHPAVADTQTSMGLARAALRHRQPRGVLGHPAPRSVLVGSMRRYYSALGAGRVSYRPHLVRRTMQSLGKLLRVLVVGVVVTGMTGWGI